MPLAHYKDLCMDVTDPDVATPFWAAALGLRPDRRDDAVTALRGPSPERTVWLNTVPEPKATKNRVHLDLNVSSVADLAALGARELDGWDTPWTVMADPEGNELCAFVRDEEWCDENPGAAVIYELSVDSADPRGQAAWWADVLGGRTGFDDEMGFAWVDDVDGLPFDSLVFAPVPEPKTVKNRLHLDVNVVDADAVDALVARGASVLREPDDEIAWTVMADPEGNEFCVFASAGPVA